jgi:SpoIID/LytB domain protein
MHVLNKPVISVGILSADKVRFELNGRFTDTEGRIYQGGMLIASINNEAIVLETGNQERIIGKKLFLQPYNWDDASFRLYDVTIGINFHWQKREDQIFKGGLKLIVTGDTITAINVLPVEDYLASVISSEMSANSSPEMLKAHAVISRSWLLAQIEKSASVRSRKTKYLSVYQDDNERIAWYDREDHRHFDVCADDHCQRYQGITRATTVSVEKAVKETAGEVLIFGNNLCDTRFSKCCGGITELFENTWEPVNHPYLQHIYDHSEAHQDKAADLTGEEAARVWIMAEPPAFCNTHDRDVLQQVLNDYDQTTQDFYRWKVSYTVKELGNLVRSRTGIDFGIIHDLIPVQRGASGRIVRLKIAGSLKTMIIGKELEIRRALSSTHLYSSAFVVEKVAQGEEHSFILYGAGWGHGVGLCQIGAAVMGSKGYSYREILMHYYRGAVLEKRY